MSELVRPPRGSAEAAVRDAALVVVGTVQEQKYILVQTGFVWTYSTVAVESYAKGSPPSPIVVRQVGGPALGEHDGVPHSFLLASESNPPLFKGDRRLMFLLSVAGGVFELQAYTGQYELEGAVLHAVSPENPLRSKYGGRTIDEVEVEIREIAKR